VHVDGESGGRGVVAEPALMLHHLREVAAAAAQLFRYCDREVAGVAQLLEVFEEEAVLTVIGTGALLESLEHVVRQDRAGM
jgi:hypothetical protein